LKPTTSVSCPDLDITFLSHRGYVRETNEDCVEVAAWPDGEALLAVVADGVGGEAGGGVASRLAVDGVRKLVDEPLPHSWPERQATLDRAVLEADTTIRAAATRDSELSYMATTVVAAVITPRGYIHRHLGDSRLYHFRKGEVLYVTTDHTVAEVMAREGEITPDEIGSHPYRHMLHSYLGGPSELMKDTLNSLSDESPSVRSFRAGDALLICTDGLHGYVAAKKLADFFSRPSTPASVVAQACVDAALAQVGHDNISVVVIRRV